MRVYIGLSAQVSERAAVRAGLTHEESGTASTPDTAVAEVLPSPAGHRSVTPTGYRYE